MIILQFSSQQQNVFFIVSMLIFSLPTPHIVLIGFRSMEFSKMSPYINFGMGVAARGWGSGALLFRAAESRVKG